MTKTWTTISWASIVCSSVLGIAACSGEPGSGQPTRSPVSGSDSLGEGGASDIDAPASAGHSSHVDPPTSNAAGATNDDQGDAAGAANDDQGDAAGAANAGAGGASETGSMPVVPGCGNGVVEAGEACDPPFSKNCGADCQPITSAACVACEAHIPGDVDDPSVGLPPELDCDLISGVAAPDSPAAGVAKSVLCNQLLDCMRDTQCAVREAPIACYVGDNHLADQVFAGLANGSCRAQFERGLETTDVMTLLSHLGRVEEYGGARAYKRIDAEETACPAECNVGP